MSKRTSVSHISQWLPVLVLLIYAALRLYHLMTLPIFLDEASHITRAQWVWQDKPLYTLTTGKALAPYVMSLFWPFVGGPFIGRYVVVLFGLVGIAACYAVGRDLHSRQAGLLGMALWILCPQIMFLERMALVDTTFSAMGMLTLWFAIRMIRRRQIHWAVLCGIGLTLAILAKLTALVYIPIPAMAAILIASRNIRWTTRVRQAIIAYVICALLLVAPFLYIRSSGEDPTGEKYGLTSTNTQTLQSRIEANTTKLIDAERTYFSDGMLLIMGIAGLAALILAWRSALILLALTFAPLLAIVATAVSLWLRYAVPAAPFALLLTAIGLVAFANRLRKWHFSPLVSILPWALAVLWAVFVAIPFQITAFTNPAALRLPQSDRFEYIDWVPSGFGIQEAVRYLLRMTPQPTTVIVTAANCDGARLYVPYGSTLTLICPGVDWGGYNDPIIQDIQRRANRDGQLYVLGEDAPIVRESDLPEPRTVVERFPRPGPYYAVKLYLIQGEATGLASP